MAEAFRIGAMDGDGPDVFGRISSLTVDNSGRVWVYDGQAAEVRVFDASGAFVRSVGRRGEGPGEFQAVAGLTVIPSGNVWAIDPRAGRISEFDTSGVFVQSHRLDGTHQRFPWSGRVDDRGSYYDIARRGSDGAEVVVEYTPELEPVDTFRVPEYPGGANNFVHETETSRTSAGIPFAGRLQWRLGGDRRMWTLQTDEYVIVEGTLAGDTLRVIKKAFEPIPVTQEQVDEALNNLIWFEGKVDRNRIPDSHPAATWFLQDDLEYTWVLRETGVRSSSEQVWDVFSPEGIYQGDVTIPFDLVWGVTPAFHDGSLVGLVRDDLGVEYIVKATIDRGSNVMRGS